MSDTPWYYADHQQQRHGPLPAVQLQHLLGQGQITADTLVWRQGMPQWEPLHSVAELAMTAPTPVEPSQDPYAAPASAVDARAMPAHAPLVDGQQAYAAFVGSNFPVYRRKWRLDLAPHGQAASATAWSWPAFLFGAFWMLYRRMYAQAAMWIGALTVLSILETLAGASDSVSLVVTVATSVAAGSVGNYLYLRHAQRMIALAQARHPGDVTAQHAALAGLGGTRWSAVFVGMAIYVVLIGALTFLLDP